MKKLEVGDRMTIYYRLVNVGSTTAYLNGLQATVLLTYGRDSPVLKWDVSRPEIANTKLEPEETELVSTGYKLPLYESEYKLWNPGESRFKIYGAVSYTDDRQIKMETGFDRVHDPNTWAFGMEQGSPYEYAD
jgi:hypothetical protein